VFAIAMSAESSGEILRIGAQHGAAVPAEARRIIYDLAWTEGGHKLRVMNMAVAALHWSPVGGFLQHAQQSL